MNGRIAQDEAVASPRRILDLLAIAARTSDALAAAGPQERLTYGDLERDVAAYAKALLALGVMRGDRVAMVTPPSVDFWKLLHATTSIGAIWVGINPRYQRRDFEHLLEDANPKAIIVQTNLDGRDYVAELSTLVPADVRMISFGEPELGAICRRTFLQSGDIITQAELEAARAAVDPEDAAVIVYTSGTTGKPKGALLSHRAITLSAIANAKWMGHDALARSICAAPVNHVGAIDNICMNVLAAGGAIIFYPEVDMPALAELSRQEKPTYLVSSPTGFAMMLGAPGGAGARMASTKLIVFGGAATSLSTLEQIAPAGARLSSVYGQTETCGIITHTSTDDNLETHAATIGQALSGSELRIAAPDGSDLGVGQTGEIQIRGPYVMNGYFNNPEATREAFTEDGFLRTGDLGQRRADGNVVFVGRLKEMFKSGGYNVYPVEIEQAICEHPAVALAAVVAIAHDTFQEVGFAFVQPEQDCAVTGEEIKAFLRERIANYKIPKVFSVETELPRLANGKLDKVLLQRRAVE